MVKSIFKGVLYAVIGTLVCVLIFALIAKWTNLDNAIIKPIMQVIKVLCIFIGVAVALKGAKSKGWLYGGIVGILYMIFTFIIFSLIDGNFVVGFAALNDLMFQTLVGVVSAFLLRMRNKDVEVA